MKKTTDSFITPEEREKWKNFAWFELCSYPLDDEFEPKRENEILEFVKSQTGDLKKAGIEVELLPREGEEIITIQVRTTETSEEVRDRLVNFLSSLQSLYLCTIRDYYLDERIPQFWGEAFSIAVPPSNPDTAQGARIILQRVMDTQTRVSREIERLTTEMERLQKVKDENEIPEEVINIQLMQIEQILESLRLQLATGEKAVPVGKHIARVTAATRISSLPPEGTRRFPIPTACTQNTEIPWHNVDDPKELIPSLCATVNDILTHRVLQAGLRRVVKDPKENVETELVYVLADPQKTDLFLKETKKVLRRIPRSPVRLDQLERGIKGILKLVEFVREFPFEPFSEDVKKVKLRSVSIDKNLPEEYPEKLIESVRALNKEETTPKDILAETNDAKKLFAGKRISEEIVSKFELILLSEPIHNITFNSGNSGYFVFNDALSKYTPAMFQGEEITKIEAIPETSYWQIVSKSGKSFVCDPDLSPLKMNEETITDYFSSALTEKNYFFLQESGWNDEEGNNIAKHSLLPAEKMEKTTF